MRTKTTNVILKMRYKVHKNGTGKNMLHMKKVTIMLIRFARMHFVYLPSQIPQEKGFE